MNVCQDFEFRYKIEQKINWLHLFNIVATTSPLSLFSGALLSSHPQSNRLYSVTRFLYCLFQPSSPLLRSKLFMASSDAITFYTPPSSSFSAHGLPGLSCTTAAWSPKMTEEERKTMLR